MRKNALLALLLVLCLVLSGCALVKKDAAVDAATEIIRLGDQVVTKGEITELVNSQLNYMSYIYSMYGYNYDPTSAEAIADAQNAVIEDFKTQLVSKAKITELGLDKLTEEEEAQLKADAEEDYQSELDSIISRDYSDSELTEEEINAKAKEDLEATGYTMDKALEEAREELLNQKLEDYIKDPVTVTEEEVRAEYDSKLEADKTSYETNASSYCNAFNNGTESYYTPAGVRLVKQILLKYSDELAAAVTEAQSRVDDAQAILDNEESTDEEKAQAELDLADAQAALQEATDAAYASIDAEADEVYAQLEAGADWDTLMEEKTDDPGMKAGRDTAETGYAVCQDMSGFDSAFVEAAMALEKIGDVSERIRGISGGYYIIRYVGDATEGEIGFDSVKEDLEESTLETKKDTTYDDTIKAWVEEKASEFKIDSASLNN